MSQQTSKTNAELLEEVGKNWNRCNEAICCIDFNKPVPEDNPYNGWWLGDLDDELRKLSNEYERLRERIANKNN